MDKYKLVVSDFDDTLLRNDLTVSAATVTAIKKLENSGGYFAICTGRMFQSIRREALKLGLKGYIMSYQGALISDIETGKTILDTPMKCEDVLKICKVFESIGAYYQTYIDDTLYVPEINEKTNYYTSLCNVEAIDVGAPLSNFIASTRKPAIKLLAMTDPEFAKKFIVEYNKKEPDFLFNISKPGFIEVISRKASKGIAVKSLCNILGINISESIAIGDSLNDLPMIEVAGLGVAVANAVEEVKSKADVVTASNDDDGVRRIIEEYCL